MKKVFIIFFIAIPAFVWGVWLAFPEQTLQSFLEKSVADKELSAGVEDLKKGFFYNLTIRRLTLLGRKGDLIYFRDLSCSIRPWSLAAMRLSMSFSGDISGGEMKGKMDIVRNKLHIALDFRDAKIKDTPFLKIAGIEGDGSISGRFAMNDNTGYLEFFSKDVHFERAVFAGTSVPLNYFQNVVGSLNIRGNEVRINSVTLEGNDIYARIKGDIKDAYFNIHLELMPGKSFTDSPLFLKAFEKYEVSPGYYVMPVRGRL